MIGGGPSDSFQLPLAFDYLATFIWAVTGALLAARRGYDIAGLGAIAIASAAGGGLLRDGLFLQQGPPVLVRNPVYFALIITGVGLVSLGGRWVPRIPLFDQTVGLVDSLGIGAYGLVGLQLSLVAGLSLPAAVFIGVVNAVGGGVLRDVLMRREPEILKPGVPAALAALAGCLVFGLLAPVLHLSETFAALVAISVVFSIRLASIVTNRTTRPMRWYVSEA